MCCAACTTSGSSSGASSSWIGAEMRIYAFDVDETLEVSGGPITIRSLYDLRFGEVHGLPVTMPIREGTVIGLNGNWAVLVKLFPKWYELFSFIGPMEMSKEIFLNQIKTFIHADDYVMVGNIWGVSGASDDKGAAERVGWRFIKESDFAAGAR